MCIFRHGMNVALLCKCIIGDCSISFNGEPKQLPQGNSYLIISVNEYVIK